MALDEFDRRLAVRGLVAVRYSDDFLIPVARKSDRDQVIEIATAQLAAMGMSVQPSKVDSMSFRDGFTFLGHDIDLSPDRRADARPSEKGTIYLARQGTSARVAKGRVQVVGHDATLLDVPQHEVERIVVFGPVGVSGELRQWALNSGTELLFLSIRGKFLGATVSGHSRQVTRRLAQYDQMRHEGFAQDLARAIVAGKIANTRALLRRRAHDADVQAAITTLGESMTRVPSTR